MRTLRIVALALVLVIALALAGCGGVNASSSAGSAKNQFAGDWVQTAGTDGVVQMDESRRDPMKMSEDVLDLAPDDPKYPIRYRYSADGTQMTITPIIIKDQIEMDDTSRTRSIHYTLDGDKLILEDYGTYERVK